MQSANGDGERWEREREREEAMGDQKRSLALVDSQQEFPVGKYLPDLRQGDEGRGLLAGRTERLDEILGRVRRGKTGMEDRGGGG